MQQDKSSIRTMERSFESISPFEFKNKLINLAEQDEKKSTRAMLNAGRGNPNWIAATPREAYFALGQFATEESRRTWNEGDLAGKPGQQGIAERLRNYTTKHKGQPGTSLLARLVDLGPALEFDPDSFVHELTDGIIGDNYPMPDRMLVHVEKIVHRYILQELCQSDPSCGAFDLFAVEGATAAMCYIFDTLTENYLLGPGDTIAIMVPIFPPYVEIPHLAKYNFSVVEIRATATDEEGRHTWQYPEEELQKLGDPAIKALFLVNPSNPPSVALDAHALKKIKQIVKDKNPNLMIITDDVYCTFVDTFRSLLAELPYNTIGVYSFSKYFGVTGWRLGVVAIQRDSVYDRLLTVLPSAQKDRLRTRYASLSLHPESLRFIDRMVADSRQVALNHTAGLSTPQQVQMALFAGFALLDKENVYKKQTQQICKRRMKLLYDGLKMDSPALPHDADYYTQFDLIEWATKEYPQSFADFLEQHYEPVDILFRLAEQSSIILLNGGGFYGPKWSIRVSLANLCDAEYSRIGTALRATLQEYVSEWHASVTK